MNDQLIITTKQRDLLHKAFYANPGLREETMALNEQCLNMLQSLPMASAEPVAEFCGTNSEDLHIAELNGTWKFIKVGTKLYTSPQALTKISADDVTDDLVSAIENAMLAITNLDNLGDDEFNRHGAAALFNAVLEHRSEAR